jgi:hypothetical protein
VQAIHGHDGFVAAISQRAAADTDKKKGRHLRSGPKATHCMLPPDWRYVTMPGNAPSSVELGSGHQRIPEPGGLIVLTTDAGAGQSRQGHGDDDACSP